jgi:4-diphosphocytidyl-2-C-methyl-D-erythritol kinase
LPLTRGAISVALFGHPFYNDRLSCCSRIFNKLLFIIGLLSLNSITTPSYAKINLHLKVLGKRPDGYHDLRMIMTRISLHDDIRIILRDKGITLSCDDPHVPSGEDNIAWRAARDFMEKTGFNRGVEIDIRKMIPMGGGLGGGSSNAASVLMGLNELTGGTVSQSDLMDMGLKLGADVPFFIFKGPAIAEGIGEKLSIVEGLPEIPLLLLNPGINVPTAEIFGNLNLGLTKNVEKHNIASFNRSISRVLSILHNDLEDVTFERYPEVKDAKELLLKSGAIGALMSGSGSTVFGVYKDLQSSERAIRQIEEESLSRGWALFSAKSL